MNYTGKEVKEFVCEHRCLPLTQNASVSHMVIVVWGVSHPLMSTLTLNFEIVPETLVSDGGSIIFHCPC